MEYKHQKGNGDDPLPIVRCPGCNRRMFDGWLFGILKCPHCNTMLKFIDKEDAKEYIQHVAK